VLADEQSNFTPVSSVTFGRRGGCSRRGLRRGDCRGAAATITRGTRALIMWPVLRLRTEIDLHAQTRMGGCSIQGILDMLRWTTLQELDVRMQGQYRMTRQEHLISIAWPRTLMCVSKLIAGQRIVANTQVKPNRPRECCWLKPCLSSLTSCIPCCGALDHTKNHDSYAWLMPPKYFPATRFHLP
jgi:hypothetical protein